MYSTCDVCLSPVYVYIYIYIHMHTYIHTYNSIYIYIYSTCDVYLSPGSAGPLNSEGLPCGENTWPIFLAPDCEFLKMSAPQSFYRVNSIIS